MEHRIDPPGDVITLHVVEFGLVAGVAFDGGVVLRAFGIFGQVFGGLVKLPLNLVDFLKNLRHLMM